MVRCTAGRLYQHEYNNKVWYDARLGAFINTNIITRYGTTHGWVPLSTRIYEYDSTVWYDVRLGAVLVLFHCRGLKTNHSVDLIYCFIAAALKKQSYIKCIWV